MTEAMKVRRFGLTRARLNAIREKRNVLIEELWSSSVKEEVDRAVEASHAGARI